MTSRIESTEVLEALDSLLDEYVSMKTQDDNSHSNYESALLNSNKPAKFENEMPVIEVNGVKGYWINRDEVQNWRGKLPIDQYEINYDRNPKIIKKKMKDRIDQNLLIGINYLRPPTPPKPGDIIIREDPPRQAPPLSPIVKREIYYVYKDGDTRKASHKPINSKSSSAKIKAKKQSKPKKETYPLIRNNKSTFHTVPQIVDQPITPKYQQTYYQQQQPAITYQQPQTNIDYQQQTYQSYPVYQQQQQQAPLYQSYQQDYYQQTYQDYYPTQQDYGYANQDYSYQQIYY